MWGDGVFYGYPFHLFFQVPSLGVDKSDQRSEKDMVWPYDGERIRKGHSVYGLIDLFSDLEIGADATNENLGKMPQDNTSMERMHGGYLTISSEDGDAGFYKSGTMKGETSKDKKVVRSTSIVKLDTLLEELENSTQSSSSTASDQLSEELSLEETSTLEDKDNLVSVKHTFVVKKDVVKHIMRRFLIIIYTLSQFLGRWVLEL